METIANRNRAISSAFCNRFALDQKLFSSEDISTSDITSFFSNLVQKFGSEVPLNNQAEVMKWVEFASSVPSELEASHATIKALDEELAKKAVLLGYGLRPSEADIIVFAALHPSVSQFSEADVKKYPNVLRWMDYIQNTEDFGGLLKPVVVSKPDFDDFSSQPVDKTVADQTSKKVPQTSKDVCKSEKNTNSEKSVTEDKALKTEPTVESKTQIKGTEEKKKKKQVSSATDGSPQVVQVAASVEKESAGKDADISVSILNIQVGLIRKAWNHPSADSLLVEEIDLGDGNLRQVVSGLAKYCSPEDLTNRRVALVTNVKPGKLRDVMSAGLVLCASSEDHTVVEPLIPPEGAIIGERISFSGYDGKPEGVLNPKKKQLEKITLHLYTDDKGIATYKGVPFMTSAGPCTSSIPKASIK